MELQLPRSPGDFNLDRVQMLLLHLDTELSLNFLDSVLLEAITHDRESGRHGHKATTKTFAVETPPGNRRQGGPRAFGDHAQA